MKHKTRTMLTAVLAATLCYTCSVEAAVMWIDETGSQVGAPAALDGSKDPVYFSEMQLSATTGRYNVTNNTVDYRLFAFGISNANTVAWVEQFGRAFACESTWCYEALNLDESNWNSEIVYFDFSGLGSDKTGEEIFGAIANVLDPGDNVLNFYRSGDGDLAPGQSWDGFLWEENLPSSQMFVVLLPDGGSGDPLFGYGIQPVPLPAAAWLLLSSCGGLGLIGYRRRA